MYVTIRNYRYIFYDILNFMKINQLRPDSYVNVRRDPDKTQCYRRIISIGLNPQDGLESYTISTIISEVISCFVLTKFKYHTPNNFHEFITLLGFDLYSFKANCLENRDPIDIQIAIDLYDDYRRGTLLFNKLMIIDSSWLFEDDDEFKSIIELLHDEVGQE